MTDTPAENYLVNCQQPHAEVIEVATRNVWQSVDPMTREALDQLALPDGIARVGVGSAVMDSHYFRQSPGASAPAPVQDRLIDGHRFIHCAIPAAKGAEQPIPNGPACLMVDKHHTLIFDAGSTLTVIRTDSGADFVQVITATPEGGGLLQNSAAEVAEFSLPAGWALRTVTATQRRVIDLPHPTQAWFFADGSSFQGPVTLPQ